MNTNISQKTNILLPIIPCDLELPSCRWRGSRSRLSTSLFSRCLLWTHLQRRVKAGFQVKLEDVQNKLDLFVLGLWGHRNEARWAVNIQYCTVYTAGLLFTASSANSTHRHTINVIKLTPSQSISNAFRLFNSWINANAGAGISEQVQIN